MSVAATVSCGQASFLRESPVPTLSWTHGPGYSPSGNLQTPSNSSATLCCSSAATAALPLQLASPAYLPGPYAIHADTSSGTDNVPCVTTTDHVDETCNCSYDENFFLCSDLSQGASPGMCLACPNALSVLSSCVQSRMDSNRPSCAHASSADVSCGRSPPHDSAAEAVTHGGKASGPSHGASASTTHTKAGTEAGAGLLGGTETESVRSGSCGPAAHGGVCAGGTVCRQERRRVEGRSDSDSGSCGGVGVDGEIGGSGQIGGHAVAGARGDGAAGALNDCSGCPQCVESQGLLLRRGFAGSGGAETCCTGAIVASPPAADAAAAAAAAAAVTLAVREEARSAREKLDETCSCGGRKGTAKASAVLYSCVSYGAGGGSDGDGGDDGCGSCCCCCAGDGSGGAGGGGIPDGSMITPRSAAILTDGASGGHGAAAVAARSDAASRNWCLTPAAPSPAGPQEEEDAAAPAAAAGVPAAAPSSVVVEIVPVVAAPAGAAVVAPEVGAVMVPVLGAAVEAEPATRRQAATMEPSCTSAGAAAAADCAIHVPQPTEAAEVTGASAAPRALTASSCAAEQRPVQQAARAVAAAAAAIVATEPQQPSRSSLSGNARNGSSDGASSTGRRSGGGGPAAGAGGMGVAAAPRRPAYGVKPSQITSQISGAQRSRAAVVIQAAWRGFRIRRLYLRLIVWRLRPPMRRQDAEDVYRGLRELPTIPEMPDVSLFTTYGRPCRFHAMHRRVWFGMEQPPRGRGGRCGGGGGCSQRSPRASSSSCSEAASGGGAGGAAAASGSGVTVATSSTALACAPRVASSQSFPAFPRASSSAAGPAFAASAAALPSPLPPPLARRPLQPLRVPPRAEADVPMSEVERILAGGFWKDDPTAAAQAAEGAGGGDGGGAGGAGGDGGGGLSLFMRAKMKQEEREAEEALQMLSYEPHDLKHLLGSLKERTLERLGDLGRTIGETLLSSGLPLLRGHQAGAGGSGGGGAAVARSLPRPGRWGAGGGVGGGRQRVQLYCSSSHPHPRVGGQQQPPQLHHPSLGASNGNNTSLSGGGNSGGGRGGGSVWGGLLGGVLGSGVVGSRSGGGGNGSWGADGAGGGGGGGGECTLRMPLLTVVDPEGGTRTEVPPGGVAIPIEVNRQRYRSRSHVTRMSF